MAYLHANNLRNDTDITVSNSTIPSHYDKINYFFTLNQHLITTLVK